MDHIITNQLLSDSQFGFISGRSTTLNLLHFLDRCSEIVAEGDVADCIFFDFAKAFDTVAHKRLLLKLHAYGIRGKLLAWLEAFLVGRTQEVYVRNEVNDRECPKWCSARERIGPSSFPPYDK